MIFSLKDYFRKVGIKMRPRIAIPADTLTEATNVINERMAPYAPKPVIEAIVKSGGVPVIFPSVSPELVPDYLGLFDGVLFAGGADVDPTFFGEEPHQRLGATYRKRDLSEIPEATIKHSQVAPGNFPSHHVNVQEDSRLYSLVGKRPYVNSRHHQLLKKIAPTLRVSAFADDGVPEAIESKENNQILAVQWHPENMFKHYEYSQKIFADFIERAKH